MAPAARSSRRAGGTPSPSAATSAGSTGASWRSRTGAAASPSRAAPPVRISRTSCSDCRGNADKIFTAPAYDAFLNDDWRVSPILTVNAGIRWEYEGPIAEQLGRLANLDAAPGFTSVRAVVGNDLLHADPRGLQPRVSMALRPVAGSSLVIRAGYGVYRNTAVYQPIALLLAQQPPLSTTLSVETSSADPLTLANGFTSAPGTARNTFAVDPDFRVGYAHNWQVLAQRDLPASLTMTATYLGAAGSHLMQAILPNTFPTGAAAPSGLARGRMTTSTRASTASSRPAASS